MKTAAVVNGVRAARQLDTTRDCTGREATSRAPAVHEAAAPQRAHRLAAEHDVAIVGLGYVGLPTALAFHAAGARVVGIDVSTARLDAIARGGVDLLLSDLDRLRLANDDASFVTTSSPSALACAAGVVVCVPTPVDQCLIPDLTLLRGACDMVVAHAVPGQVIILTSTSYVGSTADLLIEPLRKRGFTVGHDIHVAFSPERIDPGNTVHLQEDVPRIIGGATEACTQAAVRILSVYAKRVHTVSSTRAAEMTKLLENTFRAVNIAFANEVADVCRELSVDVTEVIDSAATKPFGFMAFRPGPGVGGHCIPCDPHYLLWQLRGLRSQAPLTEQAMTSIARRPGLIVDRAAQVLAGHGQSLATARVLVMGITYKPDIEDVRESPAVEILERLHAAGALVGYHDPMVPTLRSGPLDLVSLARPSLFSSDLVIMHTRHSTMDLGWLSAHRLVLDATYSLLHVPQRLLP